jgi:hypothetical protein
MKRAMATSTRMASKEESAGDGDAIVRATRVAGNEEGNDKGGKGNGDGEEEGNGNQWQQHRLHHQEVLCL